MDGFNFKILWQLEFENLSIGDNEINYLFVCEWESFVMEAMEKNTQ